MEKQVYLTFYPLTEQELGIEEEIIPIGDLIEPVRGEIPDRQAPGIYPDAVATLPDMLVPTDDRQYLQGEVLTFGDSISEIPEGAFRDRQDIRKVVLSGNIRRIGNNAFYGCRNLETVVFPDGLTDIGNFAFWGCESLRHIELPASVLRIGCGAFSGSSIRRENSDRQVILHSARTACGNGAIVCGSIECHQIDDLPANYFGTISGAGFLNTGFGAVNTDTLVVPADQAVIPDNAYSAVNCRKAILHKYVKRVGHHAFSLDKDRVLCVTNWTGEWYGDSFTDPRAVSSTPPQIEVVDLISELTSRKEKKAMHKSFLALLGTIDKSAAKQYEKTYHVNRLF